MPVDQWLVLTLSALGPGIVALAAWRVRGAWSSLEHTLAELTREVHEMRAERLATASRIAELEKLRAVDQRSRHDLGNHVQKLLIRVRELEIVLSAQGLRLPRAEEPIE